MWWLCKPQDLDCLRILSNRNSLGMIQDYLVTFPLLRSSPSSSSSYNSHSLRTGDRMSTEEIYELVDSNLHLTFDFLSILTVAAVIAAVGLITDSAVLVVAMVISPLMGPILGIV